MFYVFTLCILAFRYRYLKWNIRNTRSLYETKKYSAIHLAFLNDLIISVSMKLREISSVSLKSTLQCAKKKPKNLRGKRNHKFPLRKIRKHSLPYKNSIPKSNLPQRGNKWIVIYGFRWSKINEVFILDYLTTCHFTNLRDYL
jgi:hypothetical protein